MASVSSNSKSGGRDLNFDLDLLPIISILAVCVCFLLSMAVWIPIGTVGMQQALGEKPIGPAENPPTVFAAMQGNGDVLLTLKDIDASQKRERNINVHGVANKIDWDTMNSTLATLTHEIPQLKHAVVLPNQASNYDDVIQIMDHFKTYQINEVGISPF
jgi:biopolymer transport protein ExbD